MRKVYGKLVFEKKVDGADKPMHHTHVKLYDDDIGPDGLLASTTTMMDGSFQFEYNPREAGLFDTPDLKIEVHLWEVKFKGKKEGKWVPLKGYEPDLHDNVDAEEYDFGTIRVPCYEYAPSQKSCSPRVLVDEDHGLPQEQRLKRRLQETKLKAEVLVRASTCGLPENRTLKMGEAAFSDAYLGEIAMNGFNPCLFRKNGDGEYNVSFKWDGLMIDGDHFSPNCTARFKMGEEGTMDLVGLELQHRIGPFPASYEAPYGEVQKYNADQRVWQRIKRIWRNNYFLHGEMDTHLAATHLNIEQYIIPLMRNVRLNPVGRLLTPHFYGTIVINEAADRLLIGPGGVIPEVSPPTPSAIKVAIHKAFAQYNWHNWSPRVPVSAKHTFAHAQVLFWDVTAKYVDWFFETNGSAIKEHWAEIKLFSDELVKHAAPYSDQQEDSFYCKNEVNKASSPHPIVDGVHRAVSPVTKSETLQEDGDWENLKQLCRYLIFHSTFKHSWVNDRQFDIGGHPEFATLGLEADITDMSVDMSEATKNLDKRQLTPREVVWLLQNVRYGYIFENEDSDIHPKLQELLRGKEAEFSRLEVDIKEIRSCINV